MNKSYSWLELANMPLCCMCCGSRNVDTANDTCLSCGSTEGLWADERTDEEYEQVKWDHINFYFVCDILPINDITERGVRYARRDYKIWIRSTK